MAGRARLTRHALRALLVALVLWAAPASAASTAGAALGIAVATLVATPRARPAALHGVHAVSSISRTPRALGRPGTPQSQLAASSNEQLTPVAPPSALASPRYLLHCALLN